MRKAKTSVKTPFREWGRNARVLIATEPLWSIPMSWIFFYRPIFMKSLGVSEVEIGFTITLYSILQTFLPLLGGYLADRFGRKRVFMLFDVMGWITSLILWILATEFWQMLLAIIFEGLVTVIFPVWECMLVEDTCPEHRASIYGYINLIYVSGSLLTPLAGIMVSTYGIVAGYRAMCILALTSLTTMFILRQIFLRETEIGKALLKERGEISGFKGYRKALQIVVRRKPILLIFLCNILGALYYTISGTYNALYLTDSRGLALDESLASLVPAASSVTSILLLTIFSPMIREEKTLLKSLTIAYLLSALSLTVLVTAPKGYLSLATLSGVLSGFYTLAYPAIRTFLTNRIDVVDEKARAKVLSLSTTFSALANWLTPTLAGYAYQIDPRIPFLASIAVLTTNIFITITIKQSIKEKRERRSLE
ncbi:MAG: major facilitator superfamily protein [Candidatus Bathyarchaeota archaeon B24]|nr:MAG: major facilitator superfamily protein [Candidatus Bathyarchaeota archaeon B24]